ncbi:hypothetical protein CUR47_15200 [Lactiplantibacillus plantarum]|nr:hypothetical protein CUR47_15200 [Lactiplantibacillus plantarum]
MVNTILKEADLFCPNSVRINFTISLTMTKFNLDFRIKVITEYLFGKGSLHKTSIYRNCFPINDAN